MKTTAWILSAVMALALGCQSEQPTPAAAPIEAFTPAYYGDEVVYFDEYGQPYYIEDGQSVFIDRHDPQFEQLVSYYHSNREEYRRWQSRNR